MDFEESLDLYFIRRESDLNSLPVSTAEQKKHSMQLNYSKDVKNCIPLLLKHIKGLNKNWKETTVIKIFFDKIQFKHCLVYGMIVSKAKEYKSNHNYLIDDGTASLEATLFKNTNDGKAIRKMENELQAISNDMSSQGKAEIVKSLHNLLMRTKEQIDNSNLPIGTKVLMYGQPSCYNKQMSLKVFSLINDEKPNRDTEIFFKDYLINWYRINRITNS